MRLITKKSGILWGVQGLLGAIGLILPELLRIKRILTPLAAAGLVIIMTGATVITLIGGDVAPAVVPFVVGALAATVAYGRWQQASRPASRVQVLQPAH